MVTKPAPRKWLWITYTSAETRSFCAFANDASGWWLVEASTCPTGSPSHLLFLEGRFDVGFVIHATRQTRQIDLGTSDIPANIEPLWKTGRSWKPSVAIDDLPPDPRPVRHWRRPLDIDACLAEWLPT